MVLPNPLYVNRAEHQASALRMQLWAAFAGQQGVIDFDHLQVRALTTPGAFIDAIPGVYVVNNTAVGGDYEAYAGKFLTAERVEVPPTDSSGGRTDLVIARIEDPYAVGTGGPSGGWPEPPDVQNGPYAHIRVIPNVSANINSVVAHSDEWTAIPLARITRPASTGIVTQAHITDLRSLVDLSGERITIINNPPATAPPIAQQYWTSSTHCPGGSVIGPTSTTFRAWPTEASWQVPVPSWAQAMSIDVQIANVQMQTGDQTGEARLMFDGVPTATNSWDLNFIKVGTGPLFNPHRETISIGGKFNVPAASRGKVVTVRTDVRAFGGTGVDGTLRALNGTYVNAFLNFFRHPG